jgi:CTP:molybdopterin cytidylyltransferase MocA
MPQRGRGSPEVIVVVGADALNVEACMRGLSVRVVENLEWSRGISTSLQAGLKSARPDAQAVMSLLG